MTKRRRHSYLKPLRSQVTRFLKSLPQSRLAREQAIPYLWAQLVDEHTAALTQHVSVSEGIVKVTVEGSAWAQELSFQADEIRRRLNRALQAEIVIQVRFSAARPRERLPEADETAERSTPALSEIPLEAALVESVKQQVAESGLAPELQPALERCLLTHARLERWRRAHGQHKCPECDCWCGPDLSICPLCGAPLGSED